ncbi:MAG: phosphoribosylformylglycinamidine cyclo-ligase [Candidatus Cloacimonetes bacterium]|nr:phosphoribosylformylglycinamidine cyclo-ligase [Candidatus Cloacimonadota bacterium]
MSTISYKDAGVDIKAGEQAVSRIKSIVRETHTAKVLTDIGGFGGLFQPDLTNMSEPVLVSSTDGVGTKLIVANMSGRYGSVGQDLVNHCVNDIFVQGATPLFFLDYIGVGKVHPEKMEQIVQGLAVACKQNNVALIGGEMAEMPGIYRDEDFDLVGTIVGIIDKKDILTANLVDTDDVVVGFCSTGLHTNGYSLARKILFDKMKLSVDSYVSELDDTLQNVLLQVHKSYYPLLKAWAKPDKIHVLAHITGGGIPGNLKRVIPHGLCAEIDCSAWSVPPVYQLMQEAGNIAAPEMYCAFNMGIGMMAVAPSAVADELIEQAGGIRVGRIVAGNEKVRMIY